MLNLKNKSQPVEEHEFTSATNLEAAFKFRGTKYAAADYQFPRVRHWERKHLLDLMEIRENDLIVDLQAAAGYVSKGIKEIWGNRVGTICVEPSSTLRASIERRQHLVLSDPLERLSLPDSFVSKVGCLSGTHHAPCAALVFSEAFRVLRRGGLFAVADVRKGSAIDHWLNGFVDSQLPEGHKGVFQEPGAFSEILHRVGFVDVKEFTQTVPWEFESFAESVQFCRTLFGLTQTPHSLVCEKITSILPCQYLSGGRFQINWELIYAVGVKP